MYELKISLNEQTAIIKTQDASIQAIRDKLSHPIEIEAFGPQIFFTLLGKRSQVTLTLNDPANNEIEHEKYELTF
ncbi:hypothetical protein ACU6U9_21835 [Pseudomonas sp. HK3]|jgi:hypothetical protein